MKVVKRPSFVSRKKADANKKLWSAVEPLSADDEQGAGRALLVPKHVSLASQTQTYAADVVRQVGEPNTFTFFQVQCKRSKVFSCARPRSALPMH